MGLLLLTFFLNTDFGRGVSIDGSKKHSSWASLDANRKPGGSSRSDSHSTSKKHAEKHAAKKVEEVGVWAWLEAAASEAGLMNGTRFKTIDEMPAWAREKRDGYPKLDVVVALDEENGPERYKCMQAQAKMFGLKIHPVKWLNKTKFKTKASLTFELFQNILKKANSLPIPDDKYILFAQDDTIFHRDFRSELQLTLESLKHEKWNVFHLCPYQISWGPIFKEPTPFKPILTAKYEATQGKKPNERWYDYRLFKYLVKQKNPDIRNVGGPLTALIRKGYIPQLIKQMNKDPKRKKLDWSDDVTMVHVADKTHYVARDPQLCLQGFFNPTMYGMRENSVENVTDVHKVVGSRNGWEHILGKMVDLDSKYSDLIPI